jgi:glycosyltransferase involved in cell wall biosynthesis
MSRRGRANYSYRRPIARRIELFLHRHISGAFGNSSIVVEDLRNERIQENKLHLVYNGIEVDQFHPRENTEAEQNVADPVTFVCLANLNYYKGHSDLIQALSRVSDELPTAWQMLFVGRDDGEGDSLRALCAELNLQEHVQFLGERSDVPDILRTADIGVLASHEEGFSNAVIECMASGLPMVVSDVGGNAEAVTADVGYVVPHSDVPRLSVALLTMARSNDRAKMSKAACERVEQNYTIEACVKAYEAIYLLYLSRLHR